MYAVISDKSRQFTVREGDVIYCDLKNDASPGASITFSDVLVVGEEGAATIGKPFVEGAQVTGEMLPLAKGEKVVSLRFKKRKGVRVKKGHRQKYTPVRITGIQG